MNSWGSIVLLKRGGVAAKNIVKYLSILIQHSKNTVFFLEAVYLIRLSANKPISKNKITGKKALSNGGKL